MQLIGGVAALLIALGYFATMPAFAVAGAPPTGALARLEYHAGTVGPWWAIVALSVLTDLLFVPTSIALYTALRRWGQPTMLVATVFTVLFVALDLGVTWTGYVSLIGMGEQYAAATAAEQRAALVAAAGYPDAVLSSPLISIDSILTLGIGIFVTSLVILRSGGFCASHMFPRGANRPSTLLRMLLTDYTPGVVYHWDRVGGFARLPGTEAKPANGVEKSADERFLFVNRWFGSEVIRLTPRLVRVSAASR
jgi:hypothetical protein